MTSGSKTCRVICSKTSKSAAHVIKLYQDGIASDITLLESSAPCESPAQAADADQQTQKAVKQLQQLHKLAVECHSQQLSEMEDQLAQQLAAQQYIAVRSHGSGQWIGQGQDQQLLGQQHNSSHT